MPYPGFAGLALFGLLVGVIGTQAQAIEVEPTTLHPVHAGSFMLGPTHLVAFYVERDGQCAVTTVIEERVEDEPSASPAQIQFALAPGSRAFIRNATGVELVLVCGENADTLHVENSGSSPKLASQPTY